MPVWLLPILNPLPLPSAPRPFLKAQLFSTVTGTSCEMRSYPSSELFHARHPLMMVLGPVV